MDGPSPRVVKETKTLQTDPVPGINCTADPNNFKHFFVTIEGILINTFRARRYLLRRRKIQSRSFASRWLPHDPSQSRIRY